MEETPEIDKALADLTLKMTNGFHMLSQFCT
jgi:hypothetical protein